MSSASQLLFGKIQGLEADISYQPPRDPFYLDTYHLISFDDAPGSTTYSTDGFASSVTLSSNNGLDISTNSRFGSGALLFDGVDDYASWSGGFMGWAQSFTIEFFVKPDQLVSKAVLFSIGSGAANGLVVEQSALNPDKVSVKVDGVTPIVSTTSLSTMDYTHVAISRYSNRLELYIDGVKEGSTTYDPTIVVNEATPLLGWQSPTSDYYSGLIDEFRFTRGIGRYKQSFAKVQEPFSNLQATPKPIDLRGMTLLSESSSITEVQPLIFWTDSTGSTVICGDGSGLRQFNVSTPGDMSTLNTTSVSTHTFGGLSLDGGYVINSGEYAVVVENSTKTFRIDKMSTPGSLSTASLFSTAVISDSGGNTIDLVLISEDGKFLYTIDSDNTFRTYNLLSAFDLTTAVLFQSAKVTGAVPENTQNGWISEDEKSILFASGPSTRYISRLDISSPRDIFSISTRDRFNHFGSTSVAGRFPQGVNVRGNRVYTSGQDIDGRIIRAWDATLV